MKKEDSLRDLQIEYYSLSVTNLKTIIEEKAVQRLRDEKAVAVKRRELIAVFAMWDKFHYLEDDKTINDLCDIIKKNWDYWNPKQDAFSAIYSKQYFLNRGIDIEMIFGAGYSNRLFLPHGVVAVSDAPDSYFEKYGLKERIRWEKNKAKIAQFVKELSQQGIEKNQKQKEELKLRTFRQKVKKFYDVAIEEGLQDVSWVHIKRIGTDLGEETKDILNLLTNAVSVKLRERWETRTPPKRKVLTKSIKIEIFRRDGYKCVECGRGKDESPLHAHHIDSPILRGGTDEMANLLTLCESCNISIGERKYDPPVTWIGYKIYEKWKTKLSKN